VSFFSTYPRVAATTLLETNLVGKRGIIFILASLGVKTYSHAPKPIKQREEPTNIRMMNKLRQENSTPPCSREMTRRDDPVSERSMPGQSIFCSVAFPKVLDPALFGNRTTTQTVTRTPHGMLIQKTHYKDQHESTTAPSGILPSKWCLM
jgi:hypothetical protein